MIPNQELSGSQPVSHTQEEDPLIFVHLGQHVPRYAIENFKITANRLRGERKVIVLTETPFQGASNLFPVVISSEWYSRSLFESFIRCTRLDLSFRHGLWGHSIERFFVLAQFVRENRIGGFFHAENDVIVFSLTNLENALALHAAQAYFCRDSQLRATAALAYFKSVDAAEHLISWFLEISVADRNEMEMLALYMDECQNRTTSFPTLNQVDGTYVPSWSSLSIAVGGIADAAALGQWIAGKDPRNSLGLSWSRFRNETIQIDPTKLRLGLRKSPVELLLSYKGGRALQVFALHLHSKSIPVLRLGVFVRLVLWASNHRVPVPIGLAIRDNHTVATVSRLIDKVVRFLSPRDSSRTQKPSK